MLDDRCPMLNNKEKGEYTIRQSYSLGKLERYTVPMAIGSRGRQTGIEQSYSSGKLERYTVPMAIGSRGRQTEIEQSYSSVG